MISPASDPIGVGVVEELARLGFDYIELSLAGMADLSAQAFGQLAKRVAASGIPCEACNNFFPPRVRLTGAQARLPAALEYARPALDRAAQLGVQVIVFGSSGAKNVPAGFALTAAWQQLVELLQHVGPLAQDRGITIAIEPLNRQESNIINRASEGLQLVRAVDHPHVQLLIDYYHLMMEQEDPQIITRAGAAVRHLHLARVEGRAFPVHADADLHRFFGCVRKAGYQGRCSIEAYTKHFSGEAPLALRLLREVTQNP